MMRNLKGVDEFYVEGGWGSIWRAEVPPKGMIFKGIFP